MSDMERFFAPKSIAIIGASATPGRPGHVVIENLLANEFRGAIHPVNPRAGTILGKAVHLSIDGLPHGIDMAIVILAASANPETVRALAAKGVKAVVLVAGGFAEVDEAGEDLQGELVRAIRETGVRVLGPNTAGHISTPDNFVSSFFPLGKIPRGNISYIAQTGNFTGAMLRHIISGEHFGIARAAGLGNNLDIDETDLLEFYGADPETAAIFAYLESFRRPKRFLEIARKVTREKPVILLKGGRTAEGALAAQSHTASLGADDRILDGALRQAGIVRIDEFSHLVTVAKAAAVMPLPRGNRVGFVSPSGAFIVFLSDLARRQWNLRFPEIEAATLARLKEISPLYINVRNPVDVFPSATVHGMEFAYREAMAAILRDPNVDAVVAILILTEEIGVPPLDFIVDLAREYPEKPIYISFSGDQNCNRAAKAFLEPRGVPTFPLMEEPFKVLDILVRCREAMDRR